MGSCCSAEPDPNFSANRPQAVRERAGVNEPQGGMGMNNTSGRNNRGGQAVEHKYANGSVYKGAMVDQKREGNGVITWANGSKYVGSFKNDNMNGYGVFTW